MTTQATPPQITVEDALKKTGLTLEAFKFFSSQSTSIKESLRFKLGISQDEFKALLSKVSV